MLDLFCCAGGAGTGYDRAGFCVTGVDINPQPRYPFRFVQGDAVEYLVDHGHEYAARHGSPPCQKYTPLNAYNHHDYPDLVDPLREMFVALGGPWVIENVPQAPLVGPTVLCGTMFGLRVYRHRGFETSFPLAPPPHGPHVATCARNGYLPAEGQYMSIHGGKHSRAWQAKASLVMDLPHLVASTSGADVRTAIREVCEAIPPAMTEFVGAALLTASAAVAA
jgi:DNA (cytosine-5)-methyltransferase 1